MMSHAASLTAGHEHASTALSVLLALYRYEGRGGVIHGTEFHPASPACLPLTGSGVGAALGGFFGGAIYATWGMRTLWATGAVVAVAALALLGVAELTRHLGHRRHSLQEQLEQPMQPPEERTKGDTATSLIHHDNLPDQPAAQQSEGATHAPPLSASTASSRAELAAPQLNPDAKYGADEEREAGRARSPEECGSPGAAGRRESLAALDDAAREAHATGGAPLLLLPPDAPPSMEESAPPGSHAAQFSGRFKAGAPKAH